MLEASWSHKESVLSMAITLATVLYSFQVMWSSGCPMPWVSFIYNRHFIPLDISTALVSCHPIYDLMRDNLTLVGVLFIDTNFTMWPLFKAINIMALTPTGRVLFFSCYPSVLGVRIVVVSCYLLLTPTVNYRLQCRPLSILSSFVDGVVSCCRLFIPETPRSILMILSPGLSVLPEAGYSV